MATQGAEERSSGWSGLRSRSGLESGGSGWYNYARCRAVELMLELELVQVQFVGRSRQALSWPCGSRSREGARGRREWRRSSWSAQEGTQDARRRKCSGGRDGSSMAGSLPCAVLCCAVRLQRATRWVSGRYPGALQGEADGQTGRLAASRNLNLSVVGSRSSKSAREYTATLSPNQNRFKSNQINLKGHLARRSHSASRCSLHTSHSNSRYPRGRMMLIQPDARCFWRCSGRRKQ